MEPFCQNNPITPFNKVKSLFKNQFKKDIYEEFSYFEETPIAVGSIAQVHKAKLKDSYEYVAVKIQHPEIIKQTKGDFHVVKLSCKLAEYFFPGVKVNWIYNDFYNNMSQEIDFKTELKNIEKAHSTYKNEKYLIIPTLYKNMCSDRILTMSFEEGSSVTDLNYLKKNNINVNNLSKMINHFFNRQIFEYGFVHADPHQGNLFVTKRLNKYGKSETKLILLDFGLFINLEKDFKLSYSKLWRGIFTQNEKIINIACKELDVYEPQVFTAMITGRDYKEVMNSKYKSDYNERLKVKKGNKFY